MDGWVNGWVSNGVIVVSVWVERSKVGVKRLRSEEVVK